MIYVLDTLYGSKYNVKLTNLIKSKIEEFIKIV